MPSNVANSLTGKYICILNVAAVVNAASVSKGIVFPQRRLDQRSGAVKVARAVVKARRRIAFFFALCFYRAVQSNPSIKSSLCWVSQKFTITIALQFIPMAPPPASYVYASSADESDSNLFVFGLVGQSKYALRRYPSSAPRQGRDRAQLFS